MLIIILVLLLIFGGGFGGYYGYNRYGPPRRTHCCDEGWNIWRKSNYVIGSLQW
jgi:hypothetical protein